MERKEQHWLRRFFRSRLFFVFGAGVLIFLAFGNARAYYQEYKVQQDIRQFENQISSLKQEQIQSFELLRYVLSDDFVEAKARTDLRMKKPGEHVIIVKGGESENELITAAASPGQEVSNPLKWWYYFTHQELK